MKKSVFVLNQKGGTGKSTLASCLAAHYEATCADVQLLDADCQPDSKSAEKSSLSAVFSAAERIEIAASPAALAAKPSLSVAHWDFLLNRARTADIMCDFGANVSSSLLHWLDESDIGERLEPAGIHLDIVLVATAHPDAVADALDLAKRFSALIPPGSRRIFLVLNQAHGDFDAYVSSPEMTAFTAMVEVGDLAMVIVPRCGSEIWRDVERARLTPLAAAAMPAAELAVRLGTPELETARGRKALARWHEAVITAFQDAGLLADDGRR